jgi:hypothetical protein
MPTESRVIPADPKTAHQIRRLLAEKKKQQNQWRRSQETDHRNRSWKRGLVAACDAQVAKGVRQSGGAFRPADGTLFYAPSPSVSEARVQALERTILDHVAGRTEPPEKGTKLADYAAEAVSTRVVVHLADLALLAQQGDKKALEAYARIARTMVNGLNRQPKSSNRQLRSLASRCLNWPVLMGPSSLFSDDFKAILRDLAVGTRLPFSRDAIERLKRKPHKQVLRLAMGLACRLEQWRTREPHSIVWYQPMSPPTQAERRASGLKPFSRETWIEWCDLAWEVIMEENQDHPEANCELRGLGLYREKHSVREAQQTALSRKTGESNIRDGIKAKLRQAFAQLAKDAP